MLHVISNILDSIKGCWFPHTYRTVFDDGNYKYQECSRCGLRKVKIIHLQAKMPDYNWVRHDKDQL